MQDAILAGPLFALMIGLIVGLIVVVSEGEE